MTKKETKAYNEIVDYFKKEFPDVKYSFTESRPFHFFYIYNHDFFMDERYEKMMRELVMPIWNNKVLTFQFMYKSE